MKRILCTLLLVFGIGFLNITPISAQEAFIIDDVNIRMDVHEDGSIDVKETYQLTFDEYRHGFYRNIPNTYHMQFSEDGEVQTKNYYFPVSKVECSTTCEIEGGSDIMKVKLGDADKTVIGEHIYSISYHVQTKDLRLKNNEQALYWNLLSNFDTQTKNLSFEIHMPKAFQKDEVYTYTGAYGETGTKLNVEVVGNTIKGYLAAGSLYNNEAATIRVNLANDYFHFPEAKDATLLCSIVAIIILVICFLLFLKFGKDDDIVVTVEFKAPDGLNSAEVGYIIDAYAQNKDIISLIIDWANRGFLKIHDLEDGFKLEKLKEMDRENSKAYERVFFDALFEKSDLVKEADLKDGKVGNAINNAKSMLTQYFHNSKKRRIYCGSSTMLQILMVVLVIIPSFLFTLMAAKEMYGLFEIYFSHLIPSVLLGVSCIPWIILMRQRYVLKKSTFLLFMVLCIVFNVFFLVVVAFTQSSCGVSWVGITVSALVSLILIILLIFMDKRTKQGNQWLGQILGLKDFIVNCEKEKLEMLVKDNPSAFFSILPYAYVLGVTDVWVKKFEQIAVMSPEWYIGYNGNIFTTVLWWNHFHYCFHNISHAATYIPPTTGGKTGFGGGSFGGGGFGGGGFSGGGFGGGGGGSW